MPRGWAGSDKDFRGILLTPVSPSFGGKSRHSEARFLLKEPGCSARLWLFGLFFLSFSYSFKLCLIRLFSKASDCFMGT